MFKLPILGSKGKDVQGLLENSFKLLGRDKDLFIPVIYTAIIRSILSGIVFFAFYSFAISKNYKQGFLSVLAIIFLKPIFSFLILRYKAMISYMVSETLQNIDTDMSRAKQGVAGKNSALFIYSFIDMIISSASAKGNKKSNGFTSMILSLALAIFKEVWDLVKNFSLPAIVIDNCKIKEIPSKLMLIKKNVPAALVGILGIDVIGGVFSSILAVVFLPSLLTGGAIGYFGVDFLPAEWVFDKTIQGHHIVINLLPIFVTFYLSSVISAITLSLTSLVKTSYFTTFYLSLSNPSLISDKLRADVTRYLDFNGRLDGYKFFDNVKSNSETKGYELDVETGHDIKQVQRVANTFKLNISKGAKEAQIRKALKNKNYPDDLVQSGYELYKKSA